MKTYNIVSRLISLLLIGGGKMSQVQSGSPLDNACSGSHEFCKIFRKHQDHPNIALSLLGGKEV